MAAAVLVIASLPIALTLLGGGADWQVGEGWTLSWYPGSSDRGPIVAMLSRLGTGAGLAWLLLAVGLAAVLELVDGLLQQLAVHVVANGGDVA